LANNEIPQFKRKKWFNPGSNRGPCACEAHVITNYTIEPTHILRDDS
jgi:hypothetical protein